MSNNKFSLDPVTQQDPMLPPISNVTPIQQQPKPNAPPAPSPAAHKPFVINWRDAFNTGILQVDKDHRHLFHLVAMLRQDNVNQVMDELLTYVAEHFQHEEELMRLSNYPEMEEHVRQHEQLTNSVAKVVTATPVWTADAIEKFRSFGNKWLVGHIMNTDMKFSRWFRDHPMEYNMDSEGHYHRIQKSWWQKLTGGK